jgi:hypothetical protein
MQLSNVPPTASVNMIKSNTSSGLGLGFTPSDCLVVVHADLGLFEKDDLLRHYFLPLGNVVQFSISSHRDKYPVSVLGRIPPKGFTAGHRTVAGSLVISGGGSEALDFIRFLYRSLIGSPSRYIHTDELMPFNLMLVFLNEAGQFAYIVLKHVTILDEGTALSVDEPAYYISMSYMALDYEMFGTDNSIGTSAMLPATSTPPEIKLSFDSKVQIASVSSSATSSQNPRIVGVPYPAQPFGPKDSRPEMPGVYLSDDISYDIDPLAPRKFFPFWDSLRSGEVGNIQVPITENLSQYLPWYFLSPPLLVQKAPLWAFLDEPGEGVAPSRTQPPTPIGTSAKPYTPRPGSGMTAVPSTHPYMHVPAVVQRYYFPSDRLKITDMISGAEHTVTLPAAGRTGELSSAVDIHPIPPRSER